MRIGIGLPAAAPGADFTSIGEWAAECERLGFASLSAIDRLVYDNLDPLVALAAAAARTTRIELLTTVLNAGYRRNPVLLAKQIGSLERLSGGRLTVGLGMGGWPEDYAASGAPMTGRGAAFEDTLSTMRAVWRGETHVPALPDGRPGLLLAGSPRPASPAPPQCPTAGGALLRPAGPPGGRGGRPRCLAAGADRRGAVLLLRAGR
ncbi:LLM class flavin-dependent oxidoreductase [Amycolatopsis methanolica]|uniref:Coenzyme F420-dependent N5 N10-methylene tetrahydromethanopterin reductase-like protein n=1 Tax=Amycolatopsis methanolica 239 TaxID=1068978 RepID=A0A076MU26_AMYME|nr:LLM class flavin-dependent oxidoreductase [Amycolatopsis methanolica]AIJ22200.1 coenzyme F420-dependent N5 N10-methylene tetrahydromethanopterin reductase-like protein [Amycolatopsis methanolica 239]